MSVLTDLVSIIPAVIAATIKDLLDRHPFQLWGIRLKPGSTTDYEDKWTSFGLGNMEDCQSYERELTAQGWRTTILGSGLNPLPPPNIGV